MHKDQMVAWLQFERMMRTGVPHAIDIAAELMRYDLEVPLPTIAAKARLDLHFYCVIHQAYRENVLRLFLEVMQLLKSTLVWESVRDSRSWQLFIVELCQKCPTATRQQLVTTVVMCIVDSDRKPAAA